MSPILGVLLIATVALVSPLSADQCTRNSECPSDRCCLLTPVRYAKPGCIAFQQKGEICRVGPSTITTNLTYPNGERLEIKDVHYILCPCADGLSCNPQTGSCT